MDAGDRETMAVDAKGVQDASLERSRSRQLLERLLTAHETWFDVQRDAEVAGRAFAGFAEFHEHGEKYVLSKRAKLWEVSSNEYVFFEAVGRLGVDGLNELVAFMKTKALAAVVQPHANHMFSNLSLVVVADAVDADVERAVRATRFRKNFKWGLWGWSDLRVAVVDMAGGDSGREGRVITNAAGKPLRATLEANLGRGIANKQCK